MKSDAAGRRSPAAGPSGLLTRSRAALRPVQAFSSDALMCVRGGLRWSRWTGHRLRDRRCGELSDAAPVMWPVQVTRFAGDALEDTAASSTSSSAIGGEGRSALPGPSNPRHWHGLLTEK